MALRVPFLLATEYSAHGINCSTEHARSDKPQDSQRAWHTNTAFNNQDLEIIGSGEWRWGVSVSSGAGSNALTILTAARGLDGRGPIPVHELVSKI